MIQISYIIHIFSDFSEHLHTFTFIIMSLGLGLFYIFLLVTLLLQIKYFRIPQGDIRVNCMTSNIFNLIFFLKWFP